MSTFGRAGGGPPVLVTALIDVGRETLPGPFGRSFEGDDLPLLLRLLKAVELAMVVYVDPRHAPAVLRARGERQTVVVTLPRETIRSLPSHARVQSVRARLDAASMPWLASQPSYALADHAPVSLSRVGWLAEQARARPFGAEHVFWVNPGIARTVGLDELRDPDLPGRLREIAADRFVVFRTGNHPVAGSVWAGLYGGTNEAVQAVAEPYEALLDRALAEGSLPDPESLLGQLADQRADLFGEPFRAPDALIVSPLTRLRSPRRRDTLVTAVYDLQPSTPLGGRGYPIAWYLPTLRSVARLGAGVVVYTRPAHVDQIAAHMRAAGAEAIVVGRELESTPRHDDIQDVRSRLQFELRPERDRCHVLCHAKFAWLAEQAEANPFDSERFYWIDAGLAHGGLFPRRYLADHFGDPCSLFTPSVLDGLAADAAPLSMLGLQPYAFSSIHGIPLDVMAQWVGPDGVPIDAHVIGGLFGGERDAVHAVYPEFDRALTQMLADDRLGTEENLLTVLYHRDPAQVTLYPFTTWYHEDTGFRQPGPDDVSFYRVFERLIEAGGAR